MKKQLIIAALAIATTASSFAQGYVAFSSSKANGVWYNPGSNPANPANSQLGNNGITLGFMWANSGAPLVGSAGIAVSNSTIVPNWNSILNDPAFQFAVNSTSGALVTVAANNSGLSQGGWGYLNGVSFPVLNTTAGSTIEAFAVAWSSTYATPQLAAASGSFLGYSALFNYATGATSGAAVSTFAASGMPAFGVNPTSVPEPATFALAGLGMAAMLIARRRK